MEKGDGVKQNLPFNSYLYLIISHRSIWIRQEYYHETTLDFDFPFLRTHKG